MQCCQVCFSVIIWASKWERCNSTKDEERCSGSLFGSFNRHLDSCTWIAMDCTLQMESSFCKRSSLNFVIIFCLARQVWWQRESGGSIFFVHKCTFSSLKDKSVCDRQLLCGFMVWICYISFNFHKVLNCVWALPHFCFKNSCFWCDATNLIVEKEMLTFEQS